MGNILDKIVADKRIEVQQTKQHAPLADLQARARATDPPRNFRHAVTTPTPAGIHLIAEIKRRSPSAGLIREDFDPTAIARVYHHAGASAISVLTDGKYFDGKLDYIAQVRSAVPLPVLRKDFMVDEYQIWEARAAGADAKTVEIIKGDAGKHFDPDIVEAFLEVADEFDKIRAAKADQIEYQPETATV